MKVFFFQIAALLLLCGCDTVKLARRAQSPDDRLRGETTVRAAEIGLDDGRPHSLTNLEQLALLYQAASLQARQEVESTRLQVRMTHSGRLPQIGTSAAYNRATQNARGRESSLNAQGSWSGSLSLDLLLYDFGKLDAQERQAREEIGRAHV